MPLPHHGLPLPASCHSIEDYIAQIKSFVNDYRWLIELHVMDFVSQDHWQLLDPTWRDALLPANDPYDWDTRLHRLASNTHIDTTWPDSLQHYLGTVQSLSLPRTCQDPPAQKKEQQIERRMVGGMSDKKIHEVARMSALVDTVATQQNTRSVVDLRSGQGYLSRVLALHYQYHVVGVDMSEIQTKGAKRLDAKALPTTTPQVPHLHHITQKITPENVDHVLGSRHATEDTHWMVCGLHTCGDLGSMTLRLFVKSRQVTGLVHVGCCYHYLTEDSPCSGFPMSACVGDFALGTTARVLACQSPGRWATEAAASAAIFQHHMFRALLQDVLMRKGILTQETPLILSRLAKQKTWRAFIATALRKLRLSVEIPEQEADAYWETFQQQQMDRKLIVVWTLRALLGPVLESLILVDRYMYLQEALQGKGQVWMWPLFDGMASPRNMVIVATKSKEVAEEEVAVHGME
ncbi:methyltransferase domain-containing protein [Spinellus fusiger]|nr:methyltransferase domain-containing protein [Spinellus fusiger]